MGTVEGHCLCGGVTVRLPHSIDDVGVCHCKTCRRWGSGPWMALQVPDAQVTGETLQVYRSSSFAERGFCKTCGTHIFHRPRDGAELAVSAGLFSGKNQHVARELFFNAKPPFYSFVAESRKRTSLDLTIEWLPRMAWRRMKRLLGG